MSLKRREAQAADAVWAALADSSRREIVELLRTTPRSAGDLANQTGMAPSVVSKHLRQLKECDLVSESQPDYDARVRIYALNARPLGQLKAWLGATEEMWAGQLASFKKHIERTK
ncbi:MAG: winged helix-turn-helix transcriptional regulator [Alphaproteobacteria bacterium]|nr:winged helix-turn-helix transcriptional regulator [Alphaproteobacteria bacterium]